MRMLHGLVEGLIDVSMSLTKLSSRLDLLLPYCLSSGYVFNPNDCVFGVSSSC